MNVKFWTGVGLFAGGVAAMAVSAPWWIPKSIYDYFADADKLEVSKIFSKVKDFFYTKGWKRFGERWEDFKSHNPYSAFAFDFIGAVVFYFVLTFVTAGIGGAAAIGVNTLNAFGLKAALAGWSTVAMNAVAAVLFATFVKFIVGIPKLVQMVFKSRHTQELLSLMGYSGRAISERVSDFFNKGSWIKKSFLFIFPLLASLSLAFPVISTGLAHIFGNGFAEFIASSPGLVGIILVPAMIFTGIALISWGVTVYRNRTPEAKLANAVEKAAKQSIEEQAGAKRSTIIHRMSPDQSQRASCPPRPTDKDMANRVQQAQENQGTVTQGWQQASGTKHRPGIVHDKDVRDATDAVKSQRG